MVNRHFVSGFTIIAFGESCYARLSVRRYRFVCPVFIRYSSIESNTNTDPDKPCFFGLNFRFLFFFFNARPVRCLPKFFEFAHQSRGSDRRPAGDRLDEGPPQ